MGGMGDMSDRKGGGGGIPMAADSEAFADRGGTGLGAGLMAAGQFGGRGAAGGGANTGFPKDALQHPDLVQLDLAGLITMYRQPAEALPPEGQAPDADGTTPDEKSAETPADASAAVPTESTAAADEKPPEEVTTGELTDPARRLEVP